MTRVRSFDPRTQGGATGAKDAAAASETKGKGAKKGKKGAK